jgi:hypothetical protein
MPNSLVNADQKDPLAFDHGVCGKALMETISTTPAYGNIFYFYHQRPKQYGTLLLFSTPSFPLGFLLRVGACKGGSGAAWIWNCNKSPRCVGMFGGTLEVGSKLQYRCLSVHQQNKGIYTSGEEIRNIPAATGGLAQGEAGPAPVHRGTALPEGKH